MLSLSSPTQGTMVPFVLYSMFSFIGLVFAGEPVLYSCCEYNTTTGYQFLGFPYCEEPHPNRSFSLWPNHGTIVYNPISCSEHFEWDRREFQIEDNGVLHISSSKDHCFDGRVPDGLHEVNQYCLDYDLMNDISIVHVCVGSTDALEIPVELRISSPISAVLLFITTAIYCVKPSSKWSNSAYVITQSTALCLAFVILSGIQFFPELHNCFSCLLTGYCLQYFFLASFFWMNAHCVNLYLRISHLRPQVGSLALDSMRRTKFIRASVYSWGVPFVICVTSHLLQAFDVMPDPQFRPDIGWKVTWIYFYGPMSIIIVVNAILFALTFYSLIRHQLLTKNVRQANRTRYQREIWYCVLYLKLFIVTGLSWTAEMIGYLYKDQIIPGDRFEYLRRAADLFNCLQGVFMFIIFVCNEDVATYFKRSRLMEKCMFCSGRRVPVVKFSMTTSTSVSAIDMHAPEQTVEFDKDENKDNLSK